MEIDGKSHLIDLGTRVSRLEVQEQQAQRVRKEVREAAEERADRIELSVRSRELLQLDKLIQSVPDVREAKVEQVRRSIENSTYNVRAERVADKILGGNVLDELF